jgi:hypothetical protein
MSELSHSATSTDVRYTAAFAGTADISPASYPLGHPRSRISLPVTLLGGFEFFALPLFKLALALLGLGNLPPVVLKDAAVTRFDVSALGRFADDGRVRADRGEQLGRD